MGRLWLSPWRAAGGVESGAPLKLDYLCTSLRLGRAKRGSEAVRAKGQISMPPWRRQLTAFRSIRFSFLYSLWVLHRRYCQSSRRIEFRGTLDLHTSQCILGWHARFLFSKVLDIQPRPAPSAVRFGTIAGESYSKQLKRVS
jgi:hypothetical protein